MKLQVALSESINIILLQSIPSKFIAQLNFFYQQAYRLILKFRISSCLK